MLPRWLLSTDHKAYLASPTWQRVRAPIIARAAGCCERCGKKRKRLQVHHKTYERVGGSELPADLEALCGRCHQKHHGLLVPRRNKPKRRRPKQRRHPLARKHCQHCGGTYSKQRHQDVCIKHGLASPASL